MADFNARARHQANDTARARLGKDFQFRQHVVNLKAKNYIVYFLEYYNTLENKSVILILHNNIYTAGYIEEWIQMTEVISEVEGYVERGFELVTPDYKKYISHD